MGDNSNKYRIISQMFTKKPGVKEKDKKDMVIWHTMSTYPSEYWKSNTHFRVVSLDPGIVNFCIRVEDRFRDGTVTTVFTELKRFSEYADSYMGVYSDIIDYLNTLTSILFPCHYCIIEKQMVENYQSTRVCQHIITYFLLLFKSSPIMPLIAEINSQAKYKKLDAPGNYNKIALKKWGQEKAKDILTRRGEYALVDYINGTKGIRGQKKQDDLCDVVIQSEAFFVMYPIY